MRPWNRCPRSNGRAVTIVLGPTAVGKSQLLDNLLPLLRNRRAEVINADSRQVYRALDAGTAKPPQRLRNLLPHHPDSDIVDPDQQFTAGDFVRAADRLVADIERRGGRAVVARRRGVLPVVVPARPAAGAAGRRRDPAPVAGAVAARRGRSTACRVGPAATRPARRGCRPRTSIAYCAPWRCFSSPAARGRRSVPARRCAAISRC